MNIFDPIPRHRTLSVMLTYQCTAECLHCGTLSSPRVKTRLHVNHALKAINEAASNGYKVVVFTGGEPTLAGESLLQCIQRAASHNLVVRMVTNAHWATSERAAARRVQSFVEAGLSEINFSTGDQHARFVPIDNIFRAVEASAEAGLTVAVMVETVKEREITRETIIDDIRFHNTVAKFSTIQIWVHESPWMPLEPKYVEAYPDGITANQSNLSLRGGCDSVLSTTTIEADGRIGACCGLGMRLIPELHVGNIERNTLAEADQVAEDDFLKRWIRLEGPEQILQWAASHDQSIEWENMYAHRCQACLRLYQDPTVRRVIQEHHTEKVADVIFGEWLLFDYGAKQSA